MGYDRAKLGTKIKDIRVQRGLSQDELGRRAHTTSTTISAIETGRSGTSLDTISEIAAALEVDLISLISDLSSPLKAMQKITTRQVIDHIQDLEEQRQLLLKEIERADRMESLARSKLARENPLSEILVGSAKISLNDEEQLLLESFQSAPLPKRKLFLYVARPQGQYWDDTFGDKLHAYLDQILDKWQTHEPLSKKLKNAEIYSSKGKSPSRTKRK